MTKKNNNLINEGVVRRWGKLANLSTLTESFIDTIAEEEEEMEAEVPLSDEAPAEDEMDAEMEPMDAEMEPMDAEMEEPSLDLDEDQVEQIAQVFFDTLSQVTDGEVEFEVTSSEDDMGEEEAAEDMMDDAAMMDDEPAMMDEEPPAMYEESQDQELQEINVVDDEELTEAVLARVIERLLKNK
jgi:hypothetical protein